MNAIQSSLSCDEDSAPNPHRPSAPMPSVAVKKEAGSIYKIPEGDPANTPHPKAILKLGYTGSNNNGYNSFLVSKRYSYLCSYLYCGAHTGIFCYRHPAGRWQWSMDWTRAFNFLRRPNCFVTKHG
jgi:hypothetical protein